MGSACIACIDRQGRESVPRFYKAPGSCLKSLCFEDLKVTKTSRKTSVLEPGFAFNINCPCCDVKDLSSKMASSCVEFKIELCQYETNLFD